MTNTTLARRALVTVAIGVAVLASCSSDDDGSSTAATEATTTTVAVCEDSEALRSSVAALGEVDVVAEGTNSLTTAVDTVKSDLDAFGASASAELGPQVEAVQAGVEELETAIDGFDADGAAPVVAAVATVSTTATALFESIDAGACG